MVVRGHSKVKERYRTATGWSKPFQRRRRARLRRCSLVFAALMCMASTSAEDDHGGTLEVRRVLIGSSPGPDLTYAAGDRISVTVQFEEEVDVAGIPVLDIGIGKAKRQAPMWMHSGSRLHFGYTVDGADQDADGISVDAAALRLNGGRIVADDIKADVSLAGHAISDASGHKVDGAGTRVPQVVGVSITSDPGPDAMYAIGDEIEVTVAFDEGVTVEGAPSVAMRVGRDRRSAVYREGSGTSRLRFAYEVAAGDIAEAGIALPTNGLRGGELLSDSDGNLPQTDYAGVRKQAGHMVDGVAPAITGIELISRPPPSGVYGEGDAILIEVTFDDAVHRTEGWAWTWMPIRVGKNWRWMSAIEHRGSSVVFRHVLVADDVGSEVRFAVGGGSRHFRWTEIHDVAGNPAEGKVGGDWAREVVVDGSVQDATPPGVHSVAIVSIPRARDTYRLGERISVRVVFTEALHVTASDDSEEPASGRWASVPLRIGRRVENVRGWIENTWDRAYFAHFVRNPTLTLTVYRLRETLR